MFAVCGLLLMQVATEDTVLFTAEAYLNNMPTDTDEECTTQEAAKGKLAPLIRCPHLSQFWVAAAVLSDDAYNFLLEKLEEPVKQLLIAMQAEPGGELSQKAIRGEIEGAPASWLLPRRMYRPLTNGVQLKWTVSVADIQKLADEVCAAKEGYENLESPFTAPLGGVKFRMRLQVAWNSSSDGCYIGIFAAPGGLPSGVICQFAYKIECLQHRRLIAKNTSRAKDYQSRGVRYYFRVGALSGGWDEALWSSKGLPTTGELTFKMHITGVGHWWPN
jgi:hypothetical protein